MSRRHLRASSACWVLLGVCAGCATPGKTVSAEDLTRDHVYLGTRDALVAQVKEVLTSRQLLVVDVDENRLQTSWKVVNPPQKTGSYTEATDRRGDVVVYENVRVTLFSVDERHHVLLVERGRATSLLEEQNSLTASGAAYNQLKAAHEGVDPVLGEGTMAPLSLPRGTTEPEYTRDPGLEWEILAQVDPDGARSIQHEQIVASGRPETVAPPPPPPEVLRVASGCPDVPGLGDLLAAHRLVVLGEVHGTQQGPQFVEALACRSAAEGIPIAIGLELPREENPELERYLNSRGTAADRQRYLQGEAWHREWRDGRSSAAMLALIERVRVLRTAGADILLTGMDDPRWTGDHRDRSMAEFLDVFRRRTLDRAMIVLVGNLHAPTSGPPGFVPLGARLDRYGLRPVALVMAHGAGTAWLCLDDEQLRCGVQPVPEWPAFDASGAGGHPHRLAILPGSSPRPAVTSTGGEQGVVSPGGDLPLPPRFVRRWHERLDGLDGVFYVGPLTASRPAVAPP